jgi:tetratricopeptide (TPR) repeat protein
MENRPHGAVSRYTYPTLLYIIRQVTRTIPKRHSSIGLALACLLLLLGLVFRPHVAWGLVLVGNQFFGGHLPYNLTVADGFYTAALALDSKVPDAWHQRARIAFLNGNFNVARERINTQLALHGDSLMASYYIRGLIEGYSRNFPAAEKDFIHFLTWDPHNWAARNDLAWAYFSEGKFQDAAQITFDSLAENPGNPWILVSHAMTVYNLGYPKVAEGLLIQAQSAVEKLTEADWSHAYPGNNPNIAAQGLREFKQTIANNLALVHNGAEH